MSADQHHNEGGMQLAVWPQPEDAMPVGFGVVTG